MKKLFIFALIAVMLTGCGQNQSSTSSEGTKVTDSTDVTTTEETTTVITTETTSSITSIDTTTGQTTPAATTTAPAVTTAPPRPVITTKPPMTVITETITQAPPPPAATTSAPTNSSFQQEVVNLVNAERVKAGLGQLSISVETEKAAQVRAIEIISTMSHTRPNGTSCFTALDEQGVNYTSSGENIAGGQTTPAQVMETWMNSPGHKANILNPNFTHIGIGYAEGGNYHSNWVQMFVKLV